MHPRIMRAEGEVLRTYLASDVNWPQWLPSGDALLLNLVRKS